MSRNRVLVVPLLAVLTLLGPGALAAEPSGRTVAGLALAPAPSVSSYQYPPDVWSPPRRGVLRFGAHGAPGVTHFVYGFFGDYQDHEVPAVDGAARVVFTPYNPGPVSVVVRSATATGEVSAPRTYTFLVDGHTGALVARWRFDDGATARSAVDEVSGRAAALTGDARIVPGLGRFGSVQPQDGALVLDSTGDGARTAGPLLDTSGGFTVMAWVRLADLTATSGPARDRTIVSEDGVVRPALWLGYDADAVADADPTTRDGTFVLRMRTSDTLGAQVVQAQARREQVSDALEAAADNSDGYVSVAGRYDGAGRLDVFVGGRPAGPGARLSRDWKASGDFRLGSGHSGTGNPSLSGELEGVRVYSTALFDDEMAQASVAP